ncbi:MAG: hypothetical protein KKB03_01500 [Nanoarchaeota archaeon]|nr:hypothetical protein [Nanoarchaeota archaeon]MBU1135247.1 hypothetical protein [Nanoarchaeota archaeon]MBU2519903.1 hypothetical protein [Nanoarchaeota archaeon]
MTIQRMTAIKMNISDIVNGQWVKKEGFEPSFVVTSSGEEISRTRFLGTVVGKFVAEDGNFASITIDDSTDTIRAKTFKTAKPIDTVEIGDVIDMIGKIREYNAEIYMIPEIVKKIIDPNLELLHRLEINKRSKKPKNQRTGQSIIEEKIEDRDILRKNIISFMSTNDDGVTYGSVIENISAPEKDVESIINDLLAEGICYEPTPGKIKKI